MSFDSLSSFFEMGGYAVYVFGSYGLTIVVMMGLVFTALKQRRVFFERYRAADTNDAEKESAL
jgi:heme exporter protein D